MPVNHRPSQSLLEAIMAIGIILISTFSATTLIVTTITAGRASEAKILAANLAREGIEVVRAQRDSNWMKIGDNESVSILSSFTPYAWNNAAQGTLYLGQDSPSDYIVRISPTIGNSLQQCTVAGCAGATWTPRTLIRLARNNTNPKLTYYTNQQTCLSGWTCTNTQYSRVVHIDYRTEEPTGFGGTTIDYLDVTATVTWQDRGAKSYVMTERLYDWR